MRAFAPGRVNLIGDHTDYTGGLALPMAVQMGATVDIERGESVVDLESDLVPGRAQIDLDVRDPSLVEPAWARYVAGVVAELRPPVGGRGRVESDLPLGSGLSSSASLELAVALALGFEGSALELARLCQRAEWRAAGVPCGIMDQLTSAAGVSGHALLLDCRDESYQSVPVPADAEIRAVPSGQSRSLAGSAYAERRSECEAAEAVIGPLREASVDQLGELDPLRRRRARHVITENRRVRDFAGALAAGDLTAAGRLMVESHRSLRDDFEVSTAVLDGLVEELTSVPGVYGARLTGAGFGGCVVVLARPGAIDRGWRLTPSDGARRVED